MHYRDEERELKFDNMLKETIFAATYAVRRSLGDDDWCVSVFADNAGIVRFDDQHNVVFKVETHNHPSALEPYGGANTGIGGVIREGLIAAALTSVMILLFLGSVRSTLIIATSIPLAVLGSIIMLSMIGETLNIMTLGGLALAVGILVDEATVTIENINYHLEQGKEVERAILDQRPTWRIEERAAIELTRPSFHDRDGVAA